MSSVPSRTSGAPSEAPAIPPPGGRLRRLLLGPPLPSYVEQQERLSNPMALAILSSVGRTASASGPMFGKEKRTVKRWNRPSV